MSVGPADTTHNGPPPADAEPPPHPEAAPVATPEPKRTDLREALRPIAALLANVTVLTALLVYFGWRRSETQAHQLGIDESILGMSTREYLLRSIGPVLVLMIGISVVGLLWVAVDRRLDPGRDTTATEATAPRVPVPWPLLTLLGFAWLILPAIVLLSAFVWPRAAYVLFPASLGVGVVLMLYAAHLREAAGPPGRVRDRQQLVRTVCGGLLAGVCLFWTASNYADVLGDQLARDLAGNVDELPGVVVLSERAMHLDGPEVVETELSTEEGGLRYRYTGLRLLEHTGGKFFLVSDGWTPTYGVVFVLRADDPTMRLDFVRDRRER